MDNLESVSAVQPTEPETRDVEQQKPLRQALLALLLRQDNELRALIQDITRDDSAHFVIGYEPEPIVKPDTREEEKPDPLRSSLAQELHFLEVVNQDKAIKQMWLEGAGDEEGSQLVQLLARAAQWDEIEKLWDLLAQRCKDDQREASDDELLMLTSALAVHNCIWQERKASLLQSEKNDQFDFKKHQRVGMTGERIDGQCLPGLVNPAGKVVRSCLVRTGD